MTKISKKILYISYDGMTDQLGQSQVIPYLIGLSGKGHQIHILSAEKDENLGNRETFIRFCRCCNFRINRRNYC